jgi:hypothetical protein
VAIADDAVQLGLNRGMLLFAEVVIQPGMHRHDFTRDFFHLISQPRYPETLICRQSATLVNSA